MSLLQQSKQPEHVKNLIENDDRPYWNEEVLQWFADHRRTIEQTANLLNCSESAIEDHAERNGIEFCKETAPPDPHRWETTHKHRRGVYVLRLENDNYYVGATRQLSSRLDQHFSNGGGSQWTAKHKPVRIRKIERHPEKRWSDLLERERTLTIELMRERGWKSVRGAEWANPDLNRPPIELWPYSESWPKREWLSEEEREQYLGGAQGDAEQEESEKEDNLSKMAQELC